MCSGSHTISLPMPVCHRKQHSSNMCQTGWSCQLGAEPKAECLNPCRTDVSWSYHRLLSESSFFPAPEIRDFCL